MAYLQILNELQKINPKTKVLAVSKLQSLEKIKSLYDLGQRNFAENYVQEAVEKISQCKDLEIKWHFIGHLQKNKVKSVLGHFVSIQSLDSLELARIINRKALERGRKENVFLQVNFAREMSKEGFSFEALESVIPEIKNLDGLNVVGIMTMPPLSENPESSRPYFVQARQLRDELKKDFSGMQELSMGTSSDYLVAAEEGATWVRLGTVLFGHRPQK
jgi:pyridoxal phosphate enzyme (YggS family)